MNLSRHFTMLVINLTSNRILLGVWILIKWIYVFRNNYVKTVKSKTVTIFHSNRPNPIISLS